MIRRACHQAAYVTCLLALAIVFVPASAIVPGLGDWLDDTMWWNEVRS